MAYTGDFNFHKTLRDLASFKKLFFENMRFLMQLCVSKSGKWESSIIVLDVCFVYFYKLSSVKNYAVKL